MTFPTTREGKLVAFERMKSAAPELMDDIAKLRAQFGGTLTHFKAGAVEYGTASPEGWQIDQALIDRTRTNELTAQQRERIRKDKLASSRRKATQRKK